MQSNYCVLLSESAIGNVCDHVPAQVAGVVEAGAALTAGVRLLSRVSPQVDLQAATLCETFPALCTGIWLLPSVNAHVDAQCSLVDEGLAAICTGDRRLPGVACSVYNQVFSAEKVLTTEATVQGFVGILREEILWLGEQADMTGLTISAYD